jgi:hypothetical protein
MSTVTVELTIKVKNKFTSSNAENIQWIYLTYKRKISQSDHLTALMSHGAAAHGRPGLFGRQNHSLQCSPWLRPATLLPPRATTRDSQQTKPGDKPKERNEFRGINLQKENAGRGGS